jgi:hypothetical protein
MCYSHIIHIIFPEIFTWFTSNSHIVIIWQGNLPSIFPELSPRKLWMSLIYLITLISLWINFKFISNIYSLFTPTSYVIIFIRLANVIFLDIPAVPTSLQYENPPTQNQDLALNAVQLKCSTGCSYPQPSFTWYYSEVWFTYLFIPDEEEGKKSTYGGHRLTFCVICL